MAKPIIPLTQERLHELLHYDAETGVFTWRISPSNNVKIGAVSGSINGIKYVEIRVYGALYLAHRLAWLYVTGSFPTKGIDHIDGNRSNNSFGNLREANQAQNMQNRKKQNSNSTSGLLGVSWDKRRKSWKSGIMVNRKHIFLGRYPTKEMAHLAYLEAKKLYHPFGMLHGMNTVSPECGAREVQ